MLNCVLKSSKLEQSQMKNKIFLSWFVGGVFLGIAGLMAVAAFQTQGQVKGTSFTAGSAEILFYSSLAGTTDSSNLLSEKSFSPFELIGPNWLDTRLIKIYNKGTENLKLTFGAEVVGTDSTLSQNLNIEVFNWNDSNNDGVLADDELGTSFGTKTLKQWQTASFDLGTFETKTTKSFALKFSAGDLTDEFQKANVTYNFVFNGETE